jgi:uncharacterized protein YbjT (DUF2867 family)
MTDPMQVLVVGGTGTLGRQIAKQAIDAGHKVRCVVRSPRKALNRLTIKPFVTR